MEVTYEGSTFGHSNLRESLIDLILIQTLDVNNVEYESPRPDSNWGSSGCYHTAQ
jgi:hypothetical protein